MAPPSGPAQDSLKPAQELDTSEMRQLYVFLVSLAFSLIVLTLSGPWDITKVFRYLEEILKLESLFREGILSLEAGCGEPASESLHLS